MNPDHKYAEPLKLDKFGGHEDQKTHIYEFIKLYEVISKGFTTEHKAHFLYNNYLVDDVKTTVRHKRDDYEKMKKILVLRYGDVNRLLSNKKNLIKGFHAIRSEKLRFIRGFGEVLDQIQSLVELNVKDYPAMKNEIFSHTNVMELSSLLPEYIFVKFTEDYVKVREEYGGEHIPGNQSFSMLLSLLKQEQSKLEFSMENYPEKHEVKDETRFTSQKAQDKRDKKTVLKISDKIPIKDRLHKSTCFVHSEIKKKVAECRTGKVWCS